MHSRRAPTELWLRLYFADKINKFEVQGGALLDEILPNRATWIDAQVSGYFAHHERRGTKPEHLYASDRDAARDFLERVTPQYGPTYPWRDLGGLALAGRVDFTVNGPVPQTGDFFAPLFNERDELCVLMVERLHPLGAVGLPGGYVDWFERRARGAFRETWQETGVVAVDGPVPAVEHPDLYVRRRAGSSPFRKRTDTYVFGAFQRRSQYGASLKTKPQEDEIRAVHKVPLRRLVEGIAAGYVALFDDHNVEVILATAAFTQRMETPEGVEARQRDTQLATVWHQLEPLKPIIEGLVRNGYAKGFGNMMNSPKWPMELAQLTAPLAGRLHPANVDQLDDFGAQPWVKRGADRLRHETLVVENQHRIMDDPVMAEWMELNGFATELKTEGRVLSPTPSFGSSSYDLGNFVRVRTREDPATGIVAPHFLAERYLFRDQESSGGAPGRDTGWNVYSRPNWPDLSTPETSRQLL